MTTTTITPLPPRWPGPQWLLVTTVGWAFSPLAVGGARIEAAAEIAPLALAYLLGGVVLGALTGVGQGVVLGWRGRQLWGWTLATVAGYALGLPLSLALAFMAAQAAWPAALPALSGDPAVFVSLDLRHAALAGLVVGLGQWAVLAGGGVPRTRWAGALWVLVTWAGLGGGTWFASPLAQGPESGPALYGAGAILARAGVGLALGALTGAALECYGRAARGGAVVAGGARVMSSN